MQLVRHGVKQIKNATMHILKHGRQHNLRGPLSVQDLIRPSIGHSVRLQRSINMKVYTKQTVNIELNEEDAHKLTVILSTYTVNATQEIDAKSQECHDRVEFASLLEQELAEFR